MGTSRRAMLGAAAALGAAGAVGAAGGGVAVAGTGKSARASKVTAADVGAQHLPELLLVGANPGVTLFDGETITAFASVWRADWSIHGAGEAIVLWYDGTVRVLGADRELSYWMAQYFTRHFPEVAGLPWPDPTVEQVPVRASVDLATGLAARAGNVTVRMSGVLDRWTWATDEFELDGVPHGLSLVLGTMHDAVITVAGRRLPGQVKLGGTPDSPSSSAFITEAEVWSR